LPLQAKSLRQGGSHLLCRPHWTADSDMGIREALGRVHLVPKFIRPVKSTTLSPAQMAALYHPLLEQQAAGGSDGAAVKKWTVEGLGSGREGALVLAELLGRGLRRLPGLLELRVQRCSFGGEPGSLAGLREGLAAHGALLSLQVRPLPPLPPLSPCRLWPWHRLTRSAGAPHRRPGSAPVAWRKACCLAGPQV
jgi:hypothetical protein